LFAAPCFPLSRHPRSSQFPLVRVPLPVVLLLCFLVVGGMWWHTTIGLDFLSPPSEEEIAAIHAQAEASLPQAVLREDELPAPPPPPPAPAAPVAEPPPEPVIELGDLETPPELSSYSQFAENGASYLIDLASLLESEGEFQRAALAWERVLDSTKPEPDQAAAAIAAARRIEPSLPAWNEDPAAAIPITLHAGTGKKLAPSLKPVLEEIAAEVDRASSGTLTTTVAIATGNSDFVPDGPIPVAMWISGGKNAESTDVLSFTVRDNETLPQDVLRTVVLLIRNHFEKSQILTPPTVPPRDEEPAAALSHRITRLSWHRFGLSLQPQPAEE
jgi:hypothetical protein